MNTIGKILVVFVTVASLGFLAFVGALCSGGPDWQSEIRSSDPMRPTDLQKEFVVTTNPGEVITYTIKHRRSDTTVIDKTPVLADAVLKARKRLEDDANKKIQELTPLPQQYQEFLKTVTTLIPIDKGGVEVREQNFNARIQQLWEEIQTIGNQFSERTLETQKVLQVAEVRREENYRLTNQVELLRNDKFAAVQQRKVLEDELVRLEENRRRLERRRNQLKQQLGDGY